MKIIQCSDYNELSLYVAQQFAQTIKSKPDCVLGFATGSTPIGAYKKLREMYDKGEIDFSKVTSFNLDEYYPIPPTDKNSYHYFMKENLFSHINLPEANINIPDGITTNPDDECKKYDERIERAGGIDLQLLGIGVNGHIGFNEPSASLESMTHKTSLTEQTVKSNARFFNSPEEVPRFALTMGIGSIMKAKRIILAASGENKMKAVEMLESGKINTMWPATVLNAHPNVTLVWCK